MTAASVLVRPGQVFTGLVCLSGHIGVCVTV